jgi:hypothetical protein
LRQISDSSAHEGILWLRRIIGSISMREYKEQKEKAGEYEVVSGEVRDIYRWLPYTHQVAS